jgi:hypothetical protein
MGGVLQIPASLFCDPALSRHPPRPTLLFERKNPFDERLEIGVGNVVGGHRDRAPDAAAATLDFLLELGSVAAAPTAGERNDTPIARLQITSFTGPILRDVFIVVTPQ